MRRPSQSILFQPCLGFVSDSMIRHDDDVQVTLDESEMDLSQGLPMAAYHAAERWHPERIGALALYCSDGRWGEAFDEFCHKCLHIPRYDRWVVPGGPVWLLPHERTRAFCETGREQLDFLVRVHGLERIVLITHFGCAFYAELLHREAEECLPAQIEDLGVAATTLRGWFPQIQVETYLAMRNANQLSFHRVDT